MSCWHGLIAGSSAIAASVQNLQVLIMRTNQREWWVTIRLDCCRTRDEVIQARSAYAAAWLYSKLHPDIEVINVRPVQRS